MPSKVNYDQENKCIIVVIHGVLDMRLLQNVASEVARIIEQAGCQRIINDLRNAKLTERAIDTYNMPKVAQKAGVTPQCKRALVVGNNLREFHFLETVFVNQGNQVKIFPTMDEARNWLFDE